MKTTIFYFSGTGNSLKVARDVADGLGDTTLVPIEKADKGTVDLTAERIGIISPVYAWGLPVIVAEFAARLEPMKEKYVFSVLTFGGSPGKANVQLRSLLEKKGTVLAAGFTVNMPGNFIKMYGAQKEEKQKELFAGEAGRVGEIVDYVKAGKTGLIETSGKVMNFLGSLLYKTSSANFYRGDKTFYADDKCTGCGICEKVCPVGNITLTDGRPVWHRRCEQCLRCIQWCPAQAIQAGKATVTRERYHHPEAKASDFLG